MGRDDTHSRGVARTIHVHTLSGGPLKVSQDEAARLLLAGCVIYDAQGEWLVTTAGQRTQQIRQFLRDTQP